MRGRGLKQLDLENLCYNAMSPPMRGRGLKQPGQRRDHTVGEGRPPCGGVD